MNLHNKVYQFIIVGSGPAGVSAAWPLVLAGKSVLMIDAGGTEEQVSVNHSTVSLRELRNGRDGDFFQGVNASKLFNKEFSSPKLSASGKDFNRYSKLNKLNPVNFTLTSLIELGGLSTIWGASCALYDDDDLFDSPIKLKDLLPSYFEVVNRIGLSGNNLSPIAKFIGDQLPLQGALELTPLMSEVVRQYSRSGSVDRIPLGETLSAVRSRPSVERAACDGSMRCMWGCPNSAIYSAKHDLEKLRGFPNFQLQQNLVVDDLSSAATHHSDTWVVSGSNPTSGERLSFLSHRVLLGMGLFATTRLVMDKFLPKKTSLRVLHNPAFSCAMILPRFIGRGLPQRGYGGSQLCFKIPLSDSRGDYAFGLMFDGAGLPAIDLMRHMPFTRYGAFNITRMLLPSLIVLLVYLPPRLSDSRVELTIDNSLKVFGGYGDGYEEALTKCVDLIKAFFYKLGIYYLPKSTSGYSPGAEVHYGCTLSSKEILSEWCELNTAKGIYVIDGAALPTLTAKSHTLTIMANADRIARRFL